MNTVERVKGFLLSLLSRKFLLTVTTSVFMANAAYADNVLTPEEMIVILAPVMAFLGVEGWSDVVARRKENNK